MKLRALAGAVLVAAAVAFLSTPASASWRGHGWRWSVINAYYPPHAVYYAPPDDNFGPVGPFVGYQDGYSDGHWHPAYWRLGHSRHRYVANWQ